MINNNFIPSSENILSNIGIDPMTVQSIRPRWKRSQYKAVVQWLTEYKPSSEASNIEKVKGLIEASYHLREAEEWEKAGHVVSVCLNTPTNEKLHNQLKTWGYFQKQIELYQAFLGKISADWDAICLEGLGNASRALGEWEKASKYYQILEISITVRDIATKITALIGLANHFKFYSEYEKATNYYLQVLEIAFENSNHKGRMMALAGLGSILICLGQYKIALEYYQQQLNIATKTNDVVEEAEAIANLGYVYYFLEDYETAIKYQDQSIKTARKLENRGAEAKAFLYNGMNYSKIGKNELAIYFYEQSLEIISELGLILEQAEVLANLAISERESEKDNIQKLEEKIIERFQQALSIFDNCGNHVQRANVLKELANTYYLLDNFDIAKKYCQQALELAIQLSLPLEKECRELQAKLNIQHQYSFKLPEIREIDEQECESLKSQIDVVIMTVTDVEKGSILEFLKPYPRRQKVLKIFSESETYYLGKFGTFKTVVTQCRMGSTGQGSSILATEQALRKWNPKAIIMVGIAFGKDETKQNIGDVLVASEIISYEPQRIGEKVIDRGSHLPSNTTLLNRFENVNSWKFSGINNKPCEIRTGAILSGEKLIDNPDFKAKLFEQFPQAIGGEMEGAGLSSACIHKGISWILVKSICDWADGKKGSKYQPLAARASASLVHHVLSQKTVLNGIEKRAN